MKTQRKLLTAGAITVFSFGLAFGQQQPGEPRPGQPRAAQPGQEQKQEFQTLRATDLKGSRVVNQAGDRLGTLEDLVVELEEGIFSYAIVAAGGFLGIGAEWRPVPPEAFQPREVALGIELVLDITEDRWEQAPTIDREQIAQLTQEARGREIYQFYGQDWEAREQRITEFAAPPRERPGIEERPGIGEPHDQAQQIQQQLEQAMTLAGVEREQAQQEAQRLAQEFTRERPDQEEIEEKLEQALTRAGVDQDRAQEEAQRLSQQVHQQIEFAAPPRERKEPKEENELGAPGARIEQEQQQQEEFGVAERQRPMETEKVRLSSDVTDFAVLDRQQQEIGQINDLLVSLDQGRVAFVLFTEGTGLFAGDQEFAVAPQALEIRENQAILNVTRQELEQAQMLRHQEVAMKARELAGTDPRQARQQPQVFRYQDPNGPAIFGAPEEREEPAAPRQEPQRPGEPRY